MFSYIYMVILPMVSSAWEHNNIDFIVFVQLAKLFISWSTYVKTYGFIFIMYQYNYYRTAPNNLYEVLYRWYHRPRSHYCRRYYSPTRSTTNHVRQKHLRVPRIQMGLYKRPKRVSRYVSRLISRIPTRLPVLLWMTSFLIPEHQVSKDIYALWDTGTSLTGPLTLICPN
jgi:hypothetical protein